MRAHFKSMMVAPRTLSILVLAVLLLAAGLLHAQQQGPVLLLDVDGAIGPATAAYVTEGIEDAGERGAEAVILRMDTPGGLDSAMRQIVQAILSSPVPVVTYVAPQGARAASAGTFILYASHLAAMAPGTNLGAATPVQIGGGFGGGDEDEGADSMTQKAVNDAAAYIRSLAELRDRNAEWAEKAVREAASLTARQAAELGVIEVVATDLRALLQAIDGRTVSVAGRPVVLQTAGAEVVPVEAGWLTEILSVITNPNVALILLMIGIYGIIFELASPGAVLPGVIGAICLLFGLYALNVLPVNWAGLGLMVIGIAFIVAEAFMPSFGVLGIGGLVAFAAGIAILFDTDVPGITLSLPLLAAATATMAAGLLLIAIFVLRVHRRPVTTGEAGMVGTDARVVDWSGGKGRVRVDGELWQGIADDELKPGDKARVVGVQGLTLRLRREDDNKGDNP